MNPEPSIFTPYPILSIIAAGGLWLADSITPPVEGVPVWVTSLGLPCTIIALLVYAYQSVNKQLAASQTGRLADRDAFIVRLEATAKDASDSRERLIRATDLQTAEFREFRSLIERKFPPA